MRKKFLCMALVGAMAFSMAACGGKDKENDPTPTPSTAPTDRKEHTSELQSQR